MARVKDKLLLILAILTCCSEAYKILVVFTFPGKSHGILGEGHVRLLLEAGHEVTYITPFPIKNPHPNLHQIDTSNVLVAAPDSILNITAILNKDVDTKDFSQFIDMFKKLGELIYTNEDVVKFINDPTQEFDLVIVEWLFTEANGGLSLLFDCPLIWSSSMEPHWGILRLIDEYPNPTYNPSSQSDHSVPFSFTQRIKELVTQLMFLGFVETITYNIDNAVYTKYIAPILTQRGKYVPPLSELRYNASLVLGNSHVSLGQATRLPQNYKPIGGYHIDPKVSPLSEDLKNIMDSSKHGVIYFSMGSTLKSKDIPDEMKKDLMKMFGSLKQTVLWKFEEDLPNLPENVHILKWAPQPSILAHPKCVVFITHGGLLSTTETVHYGVPIIGIPVFADQFVNVDRSVKKGFAIRVDLAYDMAKDLKVAIEEILTNPIYREKVKHLSFIYHDRVAPPGREVVHWVEHVIRTGGAPHLRSPALMVPWYQKLYLDFVVLVLLVLVILKISISRLCKTRKNTPLTKKNK